MLSYARHIMTFDTTIHKCVSISQEIDIYLSFNCSFIRNALAAVCVCVTQNYFKIASFRMLFVLISLSLFFFKSHHTSGVLCALHCTRNERKNYDYWSFSIPAWFIWPYHCCTIHTLQSSITSKMRGNDMMNMGDGVTKSIFIYIIASTHHVK